MRLASLLLAIAVPAQAWNPTGRVLVAEDQPLVVSVEVDPEVPGFTREQILDGIQIAADSWGAGTCAIDVQFAGEVAYDDPTNVPVGQLHLTFAALGEGAPAFTRLGPPQGNEVLYVRDGREYRRSEGGAYVINSSLAMTTDAEIRSGVCVGQRSFTAIVGLLMGDTMGLGPSRDLSALMSYNVPFCEVRRPSDDDFAGLDGLYGPYFSLECGGDDVSVTANEVAGVVPFDMTCSLVPDGNSEVISARWRWGDGTTSEGNPVTHTYDADDNYSLVIDLVAEHADCGAVERRIERFNYIRACDDPAPEFRFERTRGLSFRFVNSSDVRTYGCLTDSRWEVFDEAGELVTAVTSWEPIVEVPQEGRYRVVLTLSGSAGSTSVEAWLDTTEVGSGRVQVGNGCASVPDPSHVLGPWAIVGLLCLRRRRR